MLLTKYLQRLTDKFNISSKDIVTINFLASEFLKLKPQEVLHYIRDKNSYHQEKDLLSHTLLTLHSLSFLPAVNTEDIVSALVHDAGKAVQWFNNIINEDGSIRDGKERWNFHGHDTVGAMWFWEIVLEQKWDQNRWRPVFLAIWYHMVKSEENKKFLGFLDKQTIIILQNLNCADNYGRGELWVNDYNFETNHKKALKLDKIKSLTLKLDVWKNSQESIIKIHGNTGIGQTSVSMSNTINVGEEEEIIKIKPFSEEKPEIPNIPIVVYVCGDSGSGKTTMIKEIVEQIEQDNESIDENNKIKWSYVSHDLALIRTISQHNNCDKYNLEDPWLDLSPQIRGSHKNRGSNNNQSHYKKLYKQYQSDLILNSKVRDSFKQNFEEALTTSDIIFISTTVNVLSPYRLPFMNGSGSTFISIVTAPEVQLNYEVVIKSRKKTIKKVYNKWAEKDVFGKQHNRRSNITTDRNAWLSRGTMIWVPQRECLSAIKYLYELKRFDLNPPKVLNSGDLLPWLQYWNDLIKSKIYNSETTKKWYLADIKEIIRNYYNIKLTRQGDFCNLCYEDGASYSDPFYLDCPSPAMFCRGTTFLADYEDTELKLVRLLMNRGKEAALDKWTVLSDLQDYQDHSGYYQNLINETIQSSQDNKLLCSAKVDGFLLSVIKLDLLEYRMSIAGGIILEQLINDQCLVFGTKGVTSIENNILESFLKALKFTNLSFKNFCKSCLQLMNDDNIETLAFEAVEDKRKELVVDYPIGKRGLYFLGGSCYNTEGILKFLPFYEFKNSNLFKKPKVQHYSISEYKELLLGAFPEHPEGSVWWVSHNNENIPMKLKTPLYYQFHKETKRPEYIEYQISLGLHYGWLIPNQPNKDDFYGKKILYKHCIYALIDIPEVLIKSIPILRKSRTVWNNYVKLYKNPDLRQTLDKSIMQTYYKIHNTIGYNGQKFASIPNLEDCTHLLADF